MKSLKKMFSYLLLVMFFTTSSCSLLAVIPGQVQGGEAPVLTKGFVEELCAKYSPTITFNPYKLYEKMYSGAETIYAHPWWSIIGGVAVTVASLAAYKYYTVSRNKSIERKRDLIVIVKGDSAPAATGVGQMAKALEFAYQLKDEKLNGLVRKFYTCKGQTGYDQTRLGELANDIERHLLGWTYFFGY